MVTEEDELILGDPGRKRVMFVVTALGTGGAEMMLLKLCSQLDRRYFLPIVVSLSDKGVIGAQIEALQVPVHVLGMRPSWPSMRAFQHLRRLISALKPDVIQGWMYHGNLAATLAETHRPVVWGIRQSLYGLWRERLLTRLVIRAGGWLSGRPRQIVYNSRTSADQHSAHGYSKARTRIIPNGFDTQEFRPDESARLSVRRQLLVPDDAFLIGLIARNHPMKGHSIFLAAAAALAKAFPSTHFALVGPGIDERNANLASAIAELGLTQRIALLGMRSDTQRLNAAFDVACCLSEWGEGFSNAVGEAMSCGVPCVVSDIGDSAWIVGDTGYVVPPGNAAAVVAAWKQLIELGPRGRNELGSKARERIIEHFSLGAVVQQYEALYRELLEGKGGLGCVA